MKLRNNQQGIAHLYLILALILALVIGLVGWRVWAMRSDKATDTSTAKTAEEEEPAPAVTYVQPPSEDYRIALPDTWVSGSCPDTPNLLFLAPTADKLGKCNSESGGTVSIGRNDGNTGYGEDYYTSDDYYGDVVYTAVTIDGIEGYKVAYTVATETELGYPPIGTQVVQYVLFDGTNTYQVTYTRFSGDPDLSAQAQAIAESFDVL